MIEVDGTKIKWHPHMNVAALLSILDHVEFCSVVRLNGKLISSPDFEKTIVPDKAKIELLPLVAGG